MLGMSMGELVVIVVAAAWAFGPNELPRVARAAGRLTGQATGFLYRTRAKFFKFAQEAEMNKLHEEMQATMYQLSAIRSELQGGISLFQPGPLTQRALSIKPMPGWTDAPPAEAYSAQQGQQHASAPAAGLGQAAAATQPWAAPQPWTAGMEAAPAVWAEGTHAGLEAQHAAPATLAAAPLPPQQAGPTAASQAVAGSFAASALLRAERQQQVQGPPSQGEGDEPQHPLTVTVSAVAAGWAPDRSGRAPTGSEVFLDALAEELLAAQVLRLQQQQLAMQAQAARQQAADSAAAQQAAPAEQLQARRAAAATQPHAAVDISAEQQTAAAAHPSSGGGAGPAPGNGGAAAEGSKAG